MNIYPKRDHEYGFTLIEVVIVVVIVAILAVIAIPAYQDQVNRSKRSDAKISLLGAAQALEACFTATNDYTNAQCDGAIPASSDEGYYTIAATNRAQFAYTLTATAVGAQAGDDDCDTFTIDQTGAQDATGNNPGECWN